MKPGRGQDREEIEKVEAVAGSGLIVEPADRGHDGEPAKRRDELPEPHRRQRERDAERRAATAVVRSFGNLTRRSVAWTWNKASGSGRPASA